MDREKVIKEFRNYVKTFIPCCETDDWFHELIQCVLVILEEQQIEIEMLKAMGLKMPEQFVLTDKPIYKDNT